MSRWQQTALGLGAVLLGVLLFWPASLVKSPLEQATGGRVRVLMTQGTWWHGSALLGLNDGGKTQAIPGVWQWQLGMHWASGPGLSLSLEHPTLQSPVHLRGDWQGINVDAVALQWPAAWLTGLGAPFNTIKPEGVLVLNMPAWARGQDFRLEVVWRDAQAALASIRPLGEYTLGLNGSASGQWAMTLSTVKGPLLMEGHGEWKTGQRVVFNGYASAQPQAREALTGLLSQMGRLEGDRYRLGVF